MPQQDDLRNKIKERDIEAKPKNRPSLLEEKGSKDNKMGENEEQQGFTSTIDRIAICYIDHIF